jgi:hypothetical protein
MNGSPMQFGSHLFKYLVPLPRVAVTTALCLALAALAETTHAANILWVSDVGTPGTFTGPGSNQTDSGFITLLQNAGHNVNRYNPSNASTVLLTAAELTAINTNDLIIVGRAGGSGSWQAPRAAQWNTSVLRPLIVMSPYFVRTNGAPNRLGWFSGDVGPDDTPVPLTPGPATDPTIDYIFGDVAMNGTNTAQIYSEPMDRNNSHILANPVPGGIRIATATFSREDNNVIATGNAIVGFPAGTTVRMGLDVLPAYRMFFAGGTRESATAPNAIWLYTGRETLTPVGENVFLRSVQVALNNGVAPTTNDGPAGVSVQPVSSTILQNGSASFSITVTGAAPRLVQWQRSDGAGGFTNIPGAVSAFAKASYSLPIVPQTDDGTQFQVIVSNALNVTTSDVVTLTVTPDSEPPLALSAGSVDGNAVLICFNEAVDPIVASDGANYQINSGAGPSIASVSLRPDGKSVVLTLASPMANTATLDLFSVTDIIGNVANDVITLIVTNFGLTGVDVGALNPPGTNATCDSNRFTVTGGGLDLGGTAEFMRFAYRSVSGDFDARLRVTSFVGTNDHFETTAKAILAARETTANNSPAVNVFVTPLAPGDNTVASSYRSAAAGATTALGTAVLGTGLDTSNAWLRIRRVGNQFTTYRGTNGTDWVPFGNVSIALANTLNLGAGVVSHRNGKVVTGTFADFRISPVILPAVITNSVASGGNFSASFNTQAGFNYAVEYRNLVNTGPWTTLTNIVGNGAAATFTDGLNSPTDSRFYRVIAQ